MRVDGFRAAPAADRADAARAKDEVRRDRPADMPRDTADHKAAAETRLDRARQFLDMLARWDFPPEVVARQAEKLGVEVRSALRQYASGEGFSGTATSDEVPEASHEASRHRSFVEKAYLEAMDASGEAGMASAEDHRTLAAFRTLLREIAILQEKAERQAGRTADQSRVAPAGASRGTGIG